MHKYGLNHLAILFVLLSPGCSLLSGTPGDKPSDVSPKIVTPSGQKQYWNDAGLFGPVPTDLQREGNIACANTHDGPAIGYHPHPKQFDGTYFPAAGYLCSME